MTILTNLASKTPARYNRRQLLATTAAAVVSAGPVTSLFAPGRRSASMENETFDFFASLSQLVG